jgi:L-fuconolactonase
VGRDDKDREPGLGKPSAANISAIDTRIHLFDSTRPQGAHYKGPKRFTSRVSLPAGYRALAAPLGNLGAIAVEASHRPEDDRRLLSPAQTEEIMVGGADYLQPEKPEFADDPERHRKYPLAREYFPAMPTRQYRA